MSLKCIRVATKDNSKATDFLRQSAMLDSEFAKQRVSHSNHSLEPRHCANEIEQLVIWAYVELTSRAENLHRPRTATIVRLDFLEARLTELPRHSVLVGVPPFWLEIFSPTSPSPVDSRGFFEFDEAELTSAVELIIGALRESSERIH
jgi:hypothetical protein